MMLIFKKCASAISIKNHALSALALTVFSATVLTPSNSLATTQTAAPPTSTYECTQVSLDDIDPALLTREERIALLDGSLSDSIDNYSTCVSAVQENMGGGTGAGSGSGDSQGQDAGSSEDSTKAPAGEGLASEAKPTDNKLSEPTQPNKQITPAQRHVIPPANNDKIICQLLYKEIKSVDDPDMLKGLKEQYTNYKCA